MRIIRGVPVRWGIWSATRNLQSSRFVRHRASIRHLKLAALQSMDLPADELEVHTRKVLAKSCICSDLGDTAYVQQDIPKPEGLFPAVCPGPNIAYYDRVTTVAEMVDHIYGRGPLLNRADRPHMFIKELSLNMDFLENLIADLNAASASPKIPMLRNFSLISPTASRITGSVAELDRRDQTARERILAQLEACDARLRAVWGHCFRRWSVGKR
jgi:hypothetical protein